MDERARIRIKIARISMYIAACNKFIGEARLKSHSRTLRAA